MMRPPLRKKVKTGCRTCKIRRVKCDEGRPSCQRCVSTGRTCDGYGIWGGGGALHQHTRPGPAMVLLRTLPVYPAVDQHERAALDFFYSKISRKMPGVFDSGFWAKLVFQASFKEPAVLHAVIALAAIHRSGTACQSSSPGHAVIDADADERLALQQYNKAIRHLQCHLEKNEGQSLRVALISCMIFLCVELLRGEFVTGRAHLQGGLQLLQQIQEREGLLIREDEAFAADELIFLRPRPETVDDYLVEAFTRLNVQSALFGQGSEYLYKMGRCPRPPTGSGIPLAFDSMGIARRHLDALINAVYLLSAHVDKLTYANSPISDHLVRRREAVQRTLNSWLEAYESSFSKLTTQSGHRAFLGLPLLRMYHTMASIMAATSLRGTDETMFDLHTDQFRSILQDAAELWRRVLQLKLTTMSCTGVEHQETGFTVDMGFIPPTYYTALKCRSPRLRRHAIRFLTLAPHREGVWDGPTAAAAAQRVTDVEEGAFYGESHIQASFARDAAADLTVVPEDDLPLIPGPQRISGVVVRLPEGLRGSVRLVCTRWVGERWETTELNTSNPPN